MLKRNLFVVLLLVISTVALAQDVKISGKIYNSKKEPLSWASVHYKDKKNNSAYTTTLTDGGYAIRIAKNDSATLVFSKQGYEDVTCIVPPIKEDITLDIVLPIQAKELNTVTVKGKTGRKTSTMVVDYQNLKRDYLLDGTIESIVGTYAGVSSTNELSSQYQVRGGNFDENMIYVDGMEIYRPLLVGSSQQEGLSFINPNMVRDVKFSSGGFSADYGDKMSSVLDVEYKRPYEIKPTEASVNASLMGGGVYLGNRINRFSQMTSVRYKTTRSLLSTTDTDAEYDPSFLDIQTLLTYQLSDKWSAQFLGNYSHNKYEFTPKTRETSFGTLDQLRMFKVYFNGWENDRFLTYQGALRVTGKISDDVELSIVGSAFSSDEQEYYDITGSYKLQEYPTDNQSNSNNSNNLLGVGSYHEHARNKMKADVYTIAHNGKFYLTDNTLKWGIAYQQEKIDGNIKEWEMRDSAGYSLPYNPGVINLYSNLRGSQDNTTNRYSAYLQDKYVLNSTAGTFIFDAGVRLSHWSFNKETLISPRLSIVYIPENNENLVMRVSSGIYYQSPFYKEYQLIKNDGVNNIMTLNKDIRSQKSVQYILGSDYYFKSPSGLPFKLTGEAYYKKLSDINPYTVNNVKIRYAGVNMGTGYIAGLDLRLYGEFVPNTSSWISLSLMKTEQKINGVKSPLPTDQLYNISIYFQDYFPGYERLKVSIKGSFSDGLPVSAPNTTYNEQYFRMPSYKRVDLGFSWELIGENYKIRKKNSFYGTFKNLWLGLDVLNLFDIKNTNSYYWIADVNNSQYAIPNYLTGRQLNVKLVADF